MQGILSLVETLVRDLRYAVRTLRRDAALTTFAILIIGVGIGASTTVFSVVNALWLRPLPFDDPGRLVWVANGPLENLSRQAVQVGHVVDLREQSQTKNSDPELRVLAAPPGREGRRDRRGDHPRWRAHDGRRRAATVVRLRRHVLTGAPRRPGPPLSAES